MNKQVARILKERLQAGDGLPFVEVYAGVAQAVEFVQPNSDGNQVLKRMPVSYDTSILPGCSTNPERALVPDSSKKGLLYFEDNGASFIDRVTGGSISYRSNITLVCWINRARVTGDHYSEITSYAITAILGKLGVKTIKNEGNLMRFNVIPGRIHPQSNGVFSRYTYTEVETQYLRPPFEFFGIDLIVNYTINPNCLSEFELKAAVCY